MRFMHNQDASSELQFRIHHLEPFQLCCSKVYKPRKSSLGFDLSFLSSPSEQLRSIVSNNFAISTVNEIPVVFILPKQHRHPT